MFVILNECEESRIACGADPARDPSAATLCQDDKRRLGKLLYYCFLFCCTFYFMVSSFLYSYRVTLADEAALKGR